MGADERAVDRIIAETLNRHGGEGADPDVWEAQNELYDKHTYDPALAGDANHVLAERYMLSRAMVASGQVPIEQMLAQIEAYARAIGGTAATAAPRSARRPGEGQPAPVAALAARKLAQGAWDGEAQRLRNGRPKPDVNPRVSALRNLFDSRRSH